MLMLMAACFFALPALGQSPGDPPPPGFVFLPGSIQFLPLSANEQEPRVGVRKEAGSSRMKLDIGSAVDLFGWVVAGGEFRAGAEFFTYALTTSANRLRLQVDAVDGYFGGRFTFAATTPQRTSALRLRLLHQSGHLIDGHWDYTAGFWRDGKLPVPYTRDFCELTGALGWRGDDLAVTLYTGVSYAWLARPDDLARWSTLHGVELRTTGLTGTALGKPFALYAADHLSVTGIPQYHVTMNLEAGAKFGAWDGTGIKVYGSYRSGLELFSQYFSSRRSFWGVGFALDFW